MGVATIGQTILPARIGTGKQPRMDPHCKYRHQGTLNGRAAEPRPRGQATTANALLTDRYDGLRRWMSTTAYTVAGTPMPHDGRRGPHTGHPRPGSAAAGTASHCAQPKREADLSRDFPPRCREARRQSTRRALPERQPATHGPAIFTRSATHPPHSPGWSRDLATPRDGPPAGTRQTRVHASAAIPITSTLLPPRAENRQTDVVITTGVHLYHRISSYAVASGPVKGSTQIRAEEAGRAAIRADQIPERHTWSGRGECGAPNTSPPQPFGLHVVLERLPRAGVGDRCQYVSQFGGAVSTVFSR
jgi:hypothetical protein